MLNSMQFGLVELDGEERLNENATDDVPSSYTR